MARTKLRLQEDEDERKDKLTPKQLQKLVKDICRSPEVEEEEARGVALMILVDAIEQDGSLSEAGMIAKRAAFNMCMTDCLEAQIDLVRGEYDYS